MIMFTSSSVFKLRFIISELHLISNLHYISKHHLLYIHQDAAPLLFLVIISISFKLQRISLFLDFTCTNSNKFLHPFFVLSSTSSPICKLYLLIPNLHLLLHLHLSFFPKMLFYVQLQNIHCSSQVKEVSADVPRLSRLQLTRLDQQANIFVIFTRSKQQSLMNFFIRPIFFFTLRLLKEWDSNYSPHLLLVTVTSSPVSVFLVNPSSKQNTGLPHSIPRHSLCSRTVNVRHMVLIPSIMFCIYSELNQLCFPLPS